MVAGVSSLLLTVSNSEVNGCSIYKLVHVHVCLAWDCVSSGLCLVGWVCVCLVFVGVCQEVLLLFTELPHLHTHTHTPTLHPYKPAALQHLHTYFPSLIVCLTSILLVLVLLLASCLAPRLEECLAVLFDVLY